MFETWNFTVCRVIQSCCAISWLVAPAATKPQDGELARGQRELLGGEPHGCLADRIDPGRGMHDVAVQRLLQEGRQCAGIDRLEDHAARARFERALETVPVHLQGQQHDADLFVAVLDGANELDRVIGAVGFVDEHHLRARVVDPGRAGPLRVEVAEELKCLSGLQPGSNRADEHRVVGHHDQLPHVRAAFGANGARWRVPAPAGFGTRARLRVCGSDRPRGGAIR